MAHRQPANDARMMETLCKSVSGNGSGNILGLFNAQSDLNLCDGPKRRPR
jgi:hypothetical protein